MTFIKSGMKKMNERVQLLETKDETILENLHGLNGKVKQAQLKTVPRSFRQIAILQTKDNFGERRVIISATIGTNA